MGERGIVSSPLGILTCWAATRLESRCLDECALRSLVEWNFTCNTFGNNIIKQFVLMQGTCAVYYLPFLLPFSNIVLAATIEYELLDFKLQKNQNFVNLFYAKYWPFENMVLYLKFDKKHFHSSYFVSSFIICCLIYKNCTQDKFFFGKLFPFWYERQLCKCYLYWILL